MKKITLLFAMVACFTFAANAQEKGQIRLSAGLALGTEVAINETGAAAGVGINIGAEYFFSDIISIAPSYTTFFKSELGLSSLKFSAINIDGRYYFATDGVQLYGLVGLASVTIKSEFDFLGTPLSLKASETGLNIGAGAIFPLSDNLGINLQAKYQTPGNGQIVINGGIVFSL